MTEELAAIDLEDVMTWAQKSQEMTQKDSHRAGDRAGSNRARVIQCR